MADLEAICPNKIHGGHWATLTWVKPPSQQPTWFSGPALSPVEPLFHGVYRTCSFVAPKGDRYDLLSFGCCADEVPNSWSVRRKVMASSRLNMPTTC